MKSVMSLSAWAQRNSTEGPEDKPHLLTAIPRASLGYISGLGKPGHFAMNLSYALLKYFCVTVHLILPNSSEILLAI